MHSRILYCTGSRTDLAHQCSYSRKKYSIVFNVWTCSTVRACSTGGHGRADTTDWRYTDVHIPQHSGRSHGGRGRAHTTDWASTDAKEGDTVTVAMDGHTRLIGHTQTHTPMHVYVRLYMQMRIHRCPHSPTQSEETRWS
jgi:hypothetical protein